MKYMEEQMAGTIEASLQEEENYWNETAQKINSYCEKCGYTWTAIRIFEEYNRSYRNRTDVSHTCLDVIEKFKPRLVKLYGDRISKK